MTVGRCLHCDEPVDDDGRVIYLYHYDPDEDPYAVTLHQACYEYFTAMDWKDAERVTT